MGFPAADQLVNPLDPDLPLRIWGSGQARPARGYPPSPDGNPASIDEERLR